MKSQPQTTTPLQYWDSCLFIVFLTGDNAAQARVVRELLRRAESGSIRIVISELVVAEVRPAASKTLTTQERVVVEELLDADHPFLQFFAVTHEIATRAREIGAQHPGLTVPDAVHIATALAAQADVFYTFDGDRRDNTRRRSGGLLKWHNTFGNPPLQIKSPTVDHGPLFESKQDLLGESGETADAEPGA